MDNEYEQGEDKPAANQNGKSRFNHEMFDKVSEWSFKNLPAIVSIAVAAVLPHVLGLVSGLAVYAIIMYYKNGGGNARD